MNWIYLSDDDTWCLDGEDIQIRKGTLHLQVGAITFTNYEANMIYHGTQQIDGFTNLSDAKQHAEELAKSLVND